MKNTKIAITVLISLGLAACGSSGGSSASNSTPLAQGNSTEQVQPTPTPTVEENSQPAPTPTVEENPQPTPTPTVEENPQPTPTPTVEENPQPAPTPTVEENPQPTPTLTVEENPQPAPTSSSPNEPLSQQETAYTKDFPNVGSGFVVPKNGDKIKLADLSSQNPQLIQFITLEDKDIELSHPAFNSNNVSINTEGRRLNVNKGNYTQIAFISQQNLENQYLFAGGVNITQTMPTQGVFSYKGQSLNIYAPDNVGAIKSLTEGSAEFKADFNQKVLTGEVRSTLENSAFVPVEISASITKNTFTGNSNGVKVQGGFFGENANELTGDYMRTEQQNAIGVFQAKQVK